MRYNKTNIREIGAAQSREERLIHWVGRAGSSRGWRSTGGGHWRLLFLRLLSTRLLLAARLIVTHSAQLAAHVSSGECCSLLTRRETQRHLCRSCQTHCHLHELRASLRGAGGPTKGHGWIEQQRQMCIDIEKYINTTNSIRSLGL